MGRRTLRSTRLGVELVESRQLLSVYTDLLIDRHVAAQRSHSIQPGSGPGFVPSKTSIAVPDNQTPQPTNQAIFQTGILTPREQRRQRFVARFVGPYTVGAGRTNTEAAQTFIRGAGSANTILHGDIQLNIITPKDPTIPFGGVLAIFDRNLNSNSVLGLDASGSQQYVDRAGRPTRLDQVTVDVNESAGVYDEAFAQGVVNIKYIPSGKHTRGVLDQGTAIVTIHAQVYTIGTSFILRNADINP